MVIDASVATKWFLDEDDSHLADSLLHRNLPFIAPALIRLEVSAAISKAVRLTQITSENAHLLFTAWNDRLRKGMIQLEATLEDDHRAFELSVSLGHALQDCLYIAVAQRFSLPLLTTDKKLIEKARQADVEIQLLDK